MEVKFDKWEEISKKSSNKIIERILLNLKPVLIIDNILYVDYIGEEDKKEIFNEYFNKEKVNIVSYLRKHYSFYKILSSKNLDLKKINWLKELAETFQPKGISFNILK